MKLLKILLLSFLLSLTQVSIAESEQLTQKISDELNLKQVNDGKQQDVHRLRSGINRLRSGVKLTRMPTTIGSPSYTGNFTRFDESATITFWRENIDGAQRLFVHVQPTTTAGFFYCPGGNQFAVLQNGINFGEALSVTKGDDNSACKDIYGPEIFLVDQWSTETNFDENKAFTVFYADSSSYYSGSIEVSDSDSNAASTTTNSDTVLTTTTNGSEDCVADYSVTGELHIPCVRVPGAFGKIETYDIWMQQRSGAFTFDLDLNRIQAH